MSNLLVFCKFYFTGSKVLFLIFDCMKTSKTLLQVKVWFMVTNGGGLRIHLCIVIDFVSLLMFVCYFLYFHLST